MFVKELKHCICSSVISVTINSQGQKVKFKSKGLVIITSMCATTVSLKDLLKNKAPNKEKSLKWTPLV
jgi:hypothetical protein